VQPLNLCKRDLLLAAGLALISLLAYSQFFGVQLMEFDAVPRLTFHTGRDAGQVFKIFTQGDGTSPHATGYRPFSSLVWWVILLFNGLDFQAFHAFNFALHALNAVLVFFLGRKIIRDKGGFFSFTAALVFALHPINLSVVLFVSRMPEIMVAFFLLASLLSFTAFFEGKGRRFYLLSIAFCFLGIFSKEAGALIPFALFFYCLVFLEEKGLCRRLAKALRLCTPFFSLIALYLALMLFSLGKLSGYNLPFNYSGSQLVFFFFTHLFYPIDFLAANFFDAIYFFLNQPVVNCLLLIAFATLVFPVLGFFSKERKDKPALFLLYWLLAFLFAFTAFGFLPAWYAYVPLIPFALLLSILLKWHIKKARKSSLSLLFSLLICLLFLSFAALSPLAVSYSQPLAASALTGRVLIQTQGIARELPQQSTLYLVNYPCFLLSAENGFRETIPLLNENTVQASLDFWLPEKKLAVISLTSVTVYSQLSENQFAFNPEKSTEFSVENADMESARVRTSLYWTQEKSAETGIKLEHYTGQTYEAIGITLPENGPENAFFLFFDGKQVQAIKAGNGN